MDDSLCFQCIPLLQRGHTAAITLSQVQISCLLANAFFCTFPHRNTTSSHSEYHNYPTINFSRWERHSGHGAPRHCTIWTLTPSSPSVCRLFSHWSERKMEKLKAIVHYFQVVTDESESMLKPLFTTTSAKDAEFPGISAACSFSWQLCLLCWDATKCLFVEIKLDGLVTFERRCLDDTDVQIWKW